MKKFLFWIWQLPQNLAGFIISRFAIKHITRNGSPIYYIKNFFSSGVSLGDYIILDTLYIGDVKTQKHEKGHQAQSRILGPFYLLAVGLPSIIRNIWDRQAHKKWSYSRRKRWYYGAYPENWADFLGDVQR